MSRRATGAPLASTRSPWRSSKRAASCTDASSMPPRRPASRRWRCASRYSSIQGGNACMTEPTPVRRRPALAGPDIVRILGLAANAIVLLPPRSRFSLRIGPGQLPSNGQVAGFTLDMAITRCAISAAGTAMRLGPDEWQLVGPEGDTDRIARDVEAALAGRHYSLVDISHRQVALAAS